MTGSRTRLVDELRAIVGRRQVITDIAAARAFTEGYRIGGGPVVAVVRPATLVELWRAAQACVAADCILILQAANTGLTGGSTPYGEYDRPVVVINTSRIDGIIPICEGRQVISLAGATLTKLEGVLAEFGRVPHSVIGSTCLGASVVGGICNNSGGALVNRGPAFTRHALYGRIDESGRLALVNNLGITLGDDPEQALALLDRGMLAPERIADDGEQASLAASYSNHVRALDEPTPARHNADSRQLFEASGCAGKIIVLAVRTKTFPAPRQVMTFLLASNSAADFAQLRRRVLGTFRHLPISAEYLHRDAAALAASHGNDICLAVKYLGARRMPALFAVKRWFDRAFAPIDAAPSERLLQAIGKMAPHPLPASIRPIVSAYQHLLLLTVADEGIEEARRQFMSAPVGSMVVHSCSPDEAAALQRLRFATAGATVRIAALAGKAGPLVAIDCALPRSRRDWQVVLSPKLADQVLMRADYGHFLCHVFHLDFVLKPGVDAKLFESDLLEQLDSEGIVCPAEHNFGHHYRAPENVVSFYRTLDPTNTLNPGIGQTSRSRNWL
ncbi:D-lactate dehydrogenase [Novosphingobium taihuense]|uniref:D-lactate dehydrogenase n=1 Tax=Novosphingobium taihuense TaxID=260085 RepID=UPI00119E1001|nr:D-lactate dehydrogenase [Novosphingobium taihuense]